MLLSDINELNNWSKKEIEIRCDYCKHTYSKQYKNYLLYDSKGVINKDCCTKCRKIKNTEVKLVLSGLQYDNQIIDHIINSSRIEIPAVYAIQNIRHGKLYIGSSTNVIKRLFSHILDIKRKVHHSKSLVAEYLEHGAQSFRFLILEYTTPDKLVETEYRYIQKYNSFDPKYGYNLFKEIHKNNKQKKHIKQKYKITSKLTYDDVVQIKKLILSGERLTDIAKQFGVNKSTIGDIKNLRTWTDITHPLDHLLVDIELNRKGENNSCSKLTESQVREIKHRISNGDQLSCIAKEYSVSRTLIGHIKKGKIWSFVS